MPASTRLDRSFYDPFFEIFTVRTAPGSGLEAADRAARQVLGRGWTAVPYGEGETTFEIRPRLPTWYAADRAWDLSYLLNEQEGIEDAEPVFGVHLPLPRNPFDILRLDDGAIPGRRLRRGSARSNHLEESDDRDWSLNAMRVPDAWANHFPNNPEPASGILVGHPDTGYTEHPEVLSTIDEENGHDFMKDDDDPRDELDRPWNAIVFHPGHGTSTSSVIASPRGAQGQFPGDPARAAVSGVAPGAMIAPMRIGASAVVLSTKNLSQAIERATNNGAAVISISLGGVGSGRLQDAVHYAEVRGVIVLAAAGNYVPFVTWPAAYGETVAVAASNAQDLPWEHSSHGSEVDVTAPGESVWRATAKREDGNVKLDVLRGSGTSYAVAGVAGVAALWLARHGLGFLLGQYGSDLPKVFRYLLAQTARKVPALPAGEFGAGIVHADDLLSAELPEPGSPVLRARRTEDPLRILFEQDLAARATEGPDPWTLVQEVLAPPSPKAREEAAVLVKDFEREIVFHLATRPELHERFGSLLRRGGRKRRVREDSALPIRDQLLGAASSRLSRRLESLRRE